MNRVSARIGRYAKPFFHRTRIGRCPNFSSRPWAKEKIASGNRYDPHLCAMWVKEWFLPGTRMRHGTVLGQADNGAHIDS